MKKNLKIISLTAFVLLALAQLAVPALMIRSNEEVLSRGTQLKFRTEPIDPYDQFHGRYVQLDYTCDTIRLSDKREWQRKQKVYVLFAEDSDGYARIRKVSNTQPENTDLYVEATVNYVDSGKTTLLDLNYSFDRYYMDEYKAPIAEKLYSRQHPASRGECYAQVKVYKGRAVVENIILNNKPIESYLSEEED